MFEGLENKSREVNRSTAIWKKNNHISLLLNHYLPLVKSIMLQKISYYFGGKKRVLISAFIPANTTPRANARVPIFMKVGGQPEWFFLDKIVSVVHNSPGNLHLS